MRKLVSLILFALVSANCVAQDTIWHKTVSSDKAAVQKFLNQGVSIEARFKGNGGTPLFYAATYAHNKEDMVRFIVSKGGDLNATYFNVTLLTHFLGQADAEDIVDLFLDLGADINKKDKKGKTALMYSSGFPNVSYVNKLLEKGANINLKDDEGKNAIYYALIGNAQNSIATLLAIRGADLNITDQYDRSILWWAANRNNIEVIDLAIAKGIDIDAADVGGNTPLLTALQHGKSDAAIKLILNGADLNKANKDGFTPLIMACRSDYDTNYDAIMLLFLKGQDVNQKDAYGNTSLHFLANRGRYDSNDKLIQLVEEFINRGANLNSITSQFSYPGESKKGTPLDLANLDSEVAKLLISNGAKTQNDLVNDRLISLEEKVRTLEAKLAGGALPPDPNSGSDDISIHRISAALLIEGKAGATYQLFYSTDLGDNKNWQKLEEITLIASPQVYFDKSDKGSQKRFYKVEPKE